MFCLEIVETTEQEEEEKKKRINYEKKGMDAVQIDLFLWDRSE